MSNDKYKIEDKNIDARFKEVEKKADDGKNGNFEVMNREITKNDISRLIEGKRYMDTKNNRMVVKIGQKLYKTDLTEL